MYVIRNIFCIIASVLIVTLSALAFAQNTTQPPQVFFETIPDMPLMPGLEELVDQTAAFDKPQGRIIEAVVKMNDIPRHEIIAYYSNILPQFGWKEHESYKIFIRDNEIFKLQFRENKAVFYVAPKE